MPLAVLPGNLQHLPQRLRYLRDQPGSSGGSGHQQQEGGLLKAEAVVGDEAADSPFLDRDVFCIRFKCLDEKLEDNLELLSLYLDGMDFSDCGRISDLLAANANDMKSSVLPDAHLYAMSRAMRTAMAPRYSRESSAIRVSLHWKVHSSRSAPGVRITMPSA